MSELHVIEIEDSYHRVDLGTDGEPYDLRVHATGIDITLEKCRSPWLNISGQGSITTLTITGPSREAVIRLSFDDEVECKRLDVKSCIASMTNAPTGLAEIAIEDGSLRGALRLELKNAYVHGHVTLGVENLYVDRTTIRADCAGCNPPHRSQPDGLLVSPETRVLSTTKVVASRTCVQLGILEASDAVELLLHGPLNIRPHALPAGSKLIVDTNDVTLARLPGAKPRFMTEEEWRGVARSPRGLVFGGRGQLVVDCALREPEFRDPDTLHVRLESHASLASASGRITLDAAGHGARVHGAYAPTPLAIASIAQCTGAHLANVDLFSLDSDSLDALGGAAEVLPWLPSGFVLRKEQARQVPAVDPSETVNAWRENARYWEQLSEILRQQNAPGSMQSAAHHALMHARTRSFDWRHDARGWLLSRIYALVGYGDRILLPIADWLAVAAVLAACLRYFKLVTPREPYWRLLFRVLGAPLALFHTEAVHANSPGIWDDVVYAVGQVMGIALIGISLLAIRRVVRPKSDE